MFGEIHPPPGTLWVWGLFRELNCSRQQGMDGPQPIPNTEILAWSQLTEVGLEPWEFAAIRRLDIVWLNHVRASQKSRPSR